MRKIMCESCPVRVDGALCNVPPEAQEDFRSVATNIVFRAHQVVFAEGTPSTGLYLVCSGTVKLFHADRFGREHILEVAGPGAVLGEFSLGPGQPLSISAETLTESQLALLPRERLEWFVRRYPDTAIRLIDTLTRDLGRARRKVRDLAFKDAQSRLATLLVQLAEAANGQPSRRVRLSYKRREIAEMIGVSTETAIRLLAKLKGKQVIAVDRRDIVITDLPQLTRIARHDECEP
jgi:CRP-like cAMP-binding protein